MMMMNFLPAEITIEILSRLPVDSVIECKRVCKTWRSLIDGPTFGDAHTRNLVDHGSSNYDDEDAAAAVTTVFFRLSVPQPSGIHRPNHPYGEFHFGKYINANDDDQMGRFIISKALINIDEDEDEDVSDWKIVGSSNGLVCLLSRDKSIYVYNPHTTEYVNLGWPGFKTSADDIKLYDRKGFGYHPCTNEYKVVLVYQNRYGKNEKMRREVYVYVLGSGMWRSREEEELSDRHNSLWCCSPGVLMNGALHWIRWIKNGNHYAIVSFDLADEKFKSNIMVPSVPTAAVPLAPNRHAWVELHLLGGCLCMTQHNIRTRRSDIWVMNNKNKFWTMKFRITRKKDVEEYYSPIARLGSKLLLRCRVSETIASYDIETGNIDYDDIVRDGLKYPNHVCSMFAAIPYVKSLVSLKALGEEGAENAK